jgi:hypothetical protein
MERSQSDEMARAAQRMAEAAEKMSEVLERFQGASAGAELLTEEEADLFAMASVHRAREELRREPEAPTPTPQEIREWTVRRDELRHTEPGGDL